MNERTKELLFETIQLLRTEIRTQFSDWKDADDWLFSQLSLTKSEAGEIFDGRGELVYLSSAKDDEPDKDLYEGNDVVVQEPWDNRLIEGYDGAYCRCGSVLQIKRPKIKTWHSIKCPECGFIVKLFCGEEGEPLTMDIVRACTPDIGMLGD